MDYLQRLYSLILNPIFNITRKIDVRLRNASITLCCTFLVSFFIAYYSKSKPFGLYLEHTRNNMICGGVLVILVILSVNAPLHKTKWDPVFFTLFFLAGAGIVAISFLHPIGNGYRSFGLMMMVGYPCLYYVWNNRGDYDTLYKRLAAASSIVGLVFAVYCVKMALNGELHYTSGRVDAIFFNANMFSMVGMAMTCSAIYMLAVNKGSLTWFVFSTVSFAVGWEIVILGASRISMAVCAGGVIALIAFSIKTDKTIVPARNHFRSFLRWSVIAVVTIGTIVGGSMLMDINSTIIYKREAGIEGIHTEIPDEVTEKNTVSAVGRFGAERGDINAYTAGRTTIWRGYASHLNMWGNDLSKTDFKELTGSYVQHAHNNFLEYAYRCGVPVACIHILLELYAGIVCLIFLFGKKYREPYYLFAIVFMICYAFESMFDIATLPFERHAPFYFYMALIPVFGRLNDKGEGEENASNS